MFEALTGRVMFDGPNEMAQVSAHLGHDGWPPALAEFSKKLGDTELGELFFHMLRRDPRLRPSIGEVRHRFWRLGPRLASRSWPLGGA
jgi:serine/threonine protein kinase